MKNVINAVMVILIVTTVYAFMKFTMGGYQYKLLNYQLKQINNVQETETSNNNDSTEHKLYRGIYREESREDNEQ